MHKTWEEQNTWEKLVCLILSLQCVHFLRRRAPDPHNTAHRGSFDFFAARVATARASIPPADSSLLVVSPLPCSTSEPRVVRLRSLRRGGGRA